MSGPPNGPFRPGTEFSGSHSSDIYVPAVVVKPASSRRTWLIVIGLAIGVPLALVIFIVGAGALFLLTAQEQEVTAFDRSVLVTAEDLAPWLDGLPLVPQAAKTKKVKYLDRSIEVEYEYEHPDEEHPLYLKCTVGIEQNVSDAKTTFASETIALNLGLSWAGSDAKLETMDHKDWLRWGDDSQCSVLTTHGIPIGNLFIARKGKKIFTLIFSGHCLNSAEEVRQLIKPRLDKLESYP